MKKGALLRRTAGSENEPECPADSCVSEKNTGRNDDLPGGAALPYRGANGGAFSLHPLTLVLAEADGFQEPGVELRLLDSSLLRAKRISEAEVTLNHQTQ